MTEYPKGSRNLKKDEVDEVRAPHGISPPARSVRWSARGRLIADKENLATSPGNVSGPTQAAQLEEMTDQKGHIGAHLVDFISYPNLSVKMISATSGVPAIDKHPSSWNPEEWNLCCRISGEDFTEWNPDGPNHTISTVQRLSGI